MGVASKLGGLGLALLLVAVPAHAKRFALVVGNAAYAEDRLTNPVNDALLMRKTLTELGFEVKLVQDGDRSTLLRALRDFEASIKKADVALFYFAGHGVQVEGNNYLIPIKAALESESDVRDYAVDASSVLRRIEDAGAKVGLVVLDACRNNPFVRKSRSLDRGLNRMNAPTGTIVAYATAAGSVADDGSGKNGVYTEQLARYLLEPGLDIREVFDKTASEVERLTNGKQKPREDVGLRGRFVLNPAIEIAKPEPPPLPAIDPDTAAWQQASQLHSIAGYQSYLERFAQGQYRQPAFTALNALRNNVFDPVALEKDAWQRAEHAGSIEIVEGFVQKYPNGPYAKTANALLNDLRAERAWIQVRLGDEQQLKQFISLYPSGIWAKEAQKLIEQLEAKNRFEAEQQAWSGALGKDTIQAYRQYLSSYPSGRFAAQAQDRVKVLERTAPVSSPAPAAPPTPSRQPNVLITL